MAASTARRSKGWRAGLTLSELCALYFSRTLLESLAGTPFRDEVESAFEKLAPCSRRTCGSFSTSCRASSPPKPDPLRRRRRRRRSAQQQIIARALEATLHHRQATLTYHSKSSERTKIYLVHPYRLAYAQGGLYLLAYVPEYGEVRTFAVERIEEISLLEERFTPIEELPEEAFPHSLGVHSGPPERVEIEFQPAVADYVRARAVASVAADRRRGATAACTLTLDVCLDRALRSWILSFGPFARVRRAARGAGPRSSRKPGPRCVERNGAWARQLTAHELTARCSSLALRASTRDSPSADARDPC